MWIPFSHLSPNLKAKSDFLEEPQMELTGAHKFRLCKDF